MAHRSRPSRPRPRIKSLSDLIFGLALSIGTISLIAGVPRNSADIATDLLQFGFSFLILISVWIRYTSIMSVLPLEDDTAIILNIVMLFLVSIEPYLFWLNATYASDILKDAKLLDSASTFYAIDMAALMVIMALFTHQLTIEERKLVPTRLLKKYGDARNSLLISAVIFGLTTLPIFWTLTFWDIPSRFFAWFIPLPMTWLWRARSGPR